MKLLLTALLLSSFSPKAQKANNWQAAENPLLITAPFAATLTLKSRRKLYQRNRGMVIGLQRGRYTSLEIGGEAHWRKISLLKPHIIGATANLSYNPGKNVLGYHAGVWMKHGHINLTYGADINYFTDFNNRSAFGIGPSVGFRFFGFHLVNGYNFVAANSFKSAEAALPVNTLYMSLRYYFPVKNEFTWDRQTMKKKRARKRARLKRRNERNKKIEKTDTDKKKWHLKFPFSKSQ